ncbi:MAG: hypothetical protein KIS66_17580 [Fimbriimonadaceae bacterium]|nr:hypothetical protein [Fimbriimonadaceae bacterium]
MKAKWIAGLVVIIGLAGYGIYLYISMLRFYAGIARTTVMWEGMWHTEWTEEEVVRAARQEPKADDLSIEATVENAGDREQVVHLQFGGPFGISEVYAFRHRVKLVKTVRSEDGTSLAAIASISDGGSSTQALIVSTGGKSVDEGTIIAATREDRDALDIKWLSNTKLEIRVTRDGWEVRHAGATYDADKAGSPYVIDLETPSP